jgi:RNA polymerase sigma-70 factor (ECF subfamily)
MPDHPSDWELVARVQKGDDHAFSELLTRYQRPVLNFIFRLVGQAAEAEDLAQNVFVRAYQGIHKPGFRQTAASFSTWLFQIARHAAIDQLRWRKRHPAQPLASLADEGASIAGSAKTAPAEAIARETGEQIAAAMARLPEEQRTAILLSEVEDFSQAEIATVMRCSLKSVETRLYRARQFLRAHLSHLVGS